MELCVEPKEVFHYFQEISSIPRGSHHMQEISDYMVRFAEEKHLKYNRDQAYNIVIIKEATAGYEQKEPVILQGHLDMVLVKKDWCDKNLLTEGLDLEVQGDELYAKGTSLGGDDGVAVAFCMALLASDQYKHPRLEVILTVDEEVGMEGAAVIDLSLVEGKRMINLDSEEEGIFLCSCAGGAGVKCTLPVERTKATGFYVNVQVKGLLGGHSGEEIQKERGNANKLMGRLLYEIVKEINVSLVEIHGGLADNAIPNQGQMSLLLLEETKQRRLNDILSETSAVIKRELAVRDPGLEITWEVKEAKEEALAVDLKRTKELAGYLVSVPDGVQAMSRESEGLVETSLNLGILNSSAGQIDAIFLVRSSVDSKKFALTDSLKAITEFANGKCVIEGAYPGWQYKANSPLRDKMCEIYENMYKTAPKVEAIHAGVECGFFAGKIPGLDCVSIGPDMKDIHTADERLCISSTERVWDFLLKVLEEL